MSTKICKLNKILFKLQAPLLNPFAAQSPHFQNISLFSSPYFPSYPVNLRAQA